METKKKTTKGDLERRMKSAIVLVPKDKETRSIYFDDKGLRLTLTMDYAVIDTIGHRHVFHNIVPSGVSRPYLFVKRFIDIALSNDCKISDPKGNITYSYAKLMAILKDKEDKTEYNVAWYIDLWLNNIYAPLYQIDETEYGSFMVYEQYLHNIARQHAILMEHEEDMTNKAFVKTISDKMVEFMGDMDEHVLFKKESEEEKQAKEAEALHDSTQDTSIKNAQEAN